MRSFGGRVLLLGGLLLGFVAAGTAQEKAKAPRRPTLPEGARALTDLAYVPDGGPRRMLDLYLPAKADGPLPLIIWIHGGGWQGGQKEGTGPSLRYLTRGYAVASINYRLTNLAPFPAQIQDCKAAVRYLRSIAKEHNLDTERFGAWGESAGGHLVALLGTEDETDFDEATTSKALSARVQAVCDWYGPTEFATFLDGVTPEMRERLIPMLTKLFDGPLDERKELSRQASPIAHVSKKAAPFLIVHGDKDPIVPIQQSEVFDAALKKAGIESTLFVVKGGNHGGPGFNDSDARRLTEEFFDNHLKSKR